MKPANSIRDIHSMKSAAAPICPVCAGDMYLTGTFPVAFTGGGNDHVLKYACRTCHVEMNQTVKAPCVAAT